MLGDNNGHRPSFSKDRSQSPCGATRCSDEVQTFGFGHWAPHTPDFATASNNLELHLLSIARDILASPMRSVPVLIIVHNTWTMPWALLNSLKALEYFLLILFSFFFFNIHPS